MAATVASVMAATIYAPSLPRIAIDLGTSASGAQWSLTAFVAVFGAVQLWHGPASDRLGRWRVLRWSIWLFLAGTALAGLAPTIEVLLAGRVLQGIGAAGLTVLPRAIASDSFPGTASARVFVYLSMAAGLGATLAPLIGGWLDAFTGSWRASFAVLALFGIYVLVMATRGAPSLARAQSGRPPGLRGALSDYASLMRRPTFVFTVLGGGFMRAGYFSFLTAAPFLLDSYGLASGEAGTIMATLTAAFLLANTVVVRLTERHAPETLMVVGTVIALVAPPLMAVFFLAGGGAVATVAVPIALYGFGQGLAMPMANALGVKADPRMAGAGASLLGFTGYLIAAAGTFAAGLLDHASALPLAALLGVTTVCSLAAVILARGATRRAATG